MEIISSSIYHGYEDPNLKERENYSEVQLDFSEEAQYHDETHNLLRLPPDSSENNANRNNPKFATKKKSWIKYFSLSLKFQRKFTKQSKTSAQRKQVSFGDSCFNTWKSKHGPVLFPATGVACKLSSIQEAIRKAASGSLVRWFHPIKEEIEVPYMQLEKFGYYGLRREAFGPVYLVT